MAKYSKWAAFLAVLTAVVAFASTASGATLSQVGPTLSEKPTEAAGQAQTLLRHDAGVQQFLGIKAAAKIEVTEAKAMVCKIGTKLCPFNTGKAGWRLQTTSYRWGHLRPAYRVTFTIEESVHRVTVHKLSSNILSKLTTSKKVVKPVKKTRVTKKPIVFRLVAINVSASAGAAAAAAAAASASAAAANCPGGANVSASAGAAAAAAASASAGAAVRITTIRSGSSKKAWKVLGPRIHAFATAAAAASAAAASVVEVVCLPVEQTSPPPPPAAPKVPAPIAETPGAAHAFTNGATTLFLKVKPANGRDVTVQATSDVGNVSGVQSSETYADEACPNDWQCYRARFDAPGTAGQATVTFTVRQDDGQETSVTTVVAIPKDEF